MILHRPASNRSQSQRTRQRTVYAIASVCLALAAVGCGDDGTQLRDAGEDGSVAPKTRGRVSGHVFRADTLKPVGGVVITGPNGVTAQTDDEGGFELSMLETQRTALVATGDGFARAIEPVEVVGGQTVSVDFRLIAVTAAAELDSSKGGEVRAASGAAVTIDEGAFLDSEGKPVTGMVSVQLSVLDPSTPAGLQAFPGDFVATSKSGSEGQLETFVPMEITVRSGDKVLDFAQGKGAEVNFPVPDGLKDKAPQTIALWSLSPTTGAWVEEGTATLITDGSGNVVYRGRLTHMSWWNCDRFMDQVTCIRGCVTRDGKPAPQVLTQAEGIDYSNIGQDLTGADGCFAQDVKAGAQLRVRALTQDASSDWKVITAPTTLMRSKEGTSSCMDVGTIELASRQADDMGCPSGTTKCGDRCVDVASDYDNCGGCGRTCFGGLRGAQCIEGQCACNASETRCDTFAGEACTNLAFDEDNCGACGKRCGIGQNCEQGTCKQLSCPSGFTLCGSTCVDTKTSGQHCGACDAPCAMGQSCNAGSCEALRCPDTLEMCGTACVVKGTCNGAADCKRTFPCSDTSSVSICKLCDGVSDCDNGKDEAPSSMGGGCAMCSNGMPAAACNGVKDCAGGEDEQGCGGTTMPMAGSGADAGVAGSPASDGGKAGAAGGGTGAGGAAGAAVPDGGTSTGGTGAAGTGGSGGTGAAGSGAGGTGGAAGAAVPDGGTSTGGTGAAGAGGVGGGGDDDAGTSTGGTGGAADGGAGGCGPDAFACPGTQLCISKAKLCDQVEDCPSGEDEKECSGGGCPQGQVECPDHSCVDTPDQCPNSSCPEGMFACPNGGCAPSPEQCQSNSCDRGQVSCDDADGKSICATLCDQVTECGNGSDEDAGRCCSEVGGVLCLDAKEDMVCVTADHVCADDGAQCADGADEDPRTCCEKQGGLLCDDEKGPICVPPTQICANDGSQCLDGTDENPEECCKLKDGSLCGSGECIELNQRCDQANDCADGSDESLVTCGCPEPGQWACQDNSKCISETLVCNGGTPDCADGSDESQEACAGGSCPEGQVLCPDKSCAPDVGACNK